MSKRALSINRRSNGADQALEAAVRALRQRRPDEAERLASGVLKIDRSNVVAARLFGQALLALNRPLEAIDPLRGAARRGDDPEIETLLARALTLAGRADEALDHLRRATECRPPFPLAFLVLGERLGRAGRFEEGVAVFETGLALVPDAAMLLMGLGYLYLSRNDRPSARRLFLRAGAIAPARHDAQLALAGVMAMDGEYASAAGLFRRALQVRPDDRATRINLGKCLLEMGEREAGEASLRAAARGAGGMDGTAILALAATARGRFFLRPSDAARFLRGETNRP